MRRTLPTPSDSRLPTPDSRLSHSRRGAALIIVLGLLAVLMLMAMAFAISMRTERGGASNQRHATVARQMLDTAVSRAMADLDLELGADPTPTPPWMVYASANNASNDLIRAGVLSYESAQYLPPDQLAAAQLANPGWLPVTGGVGSTNAASVIIGRYAYIVINNSGYLDANLVGDDPLNLDARSNGLDAAEIRIYDADYYRNPAPAGLVGLVSTNDAAEFIGRRKSAHGRYETGSELMRLTSQTRFDGKTNASALPPDKDGYIARTFPDGRNFTANSLCTSSFSLETFGPVTPGSVTAGNPYGIRPRKFDISKGTLDTYTPDLGTKIAATFEQAFTATRASLLGVPGVGSAQALMCPCFVAPPNGRIPQSAVATASLLDYVDDDLLPGRNAGGTEYAKIAGIHWSCRPCSEPIPMVDRFLILQTPDARYTATENFNEADPPQLTSYTHTFPLVVMAQSVYLNRTVPPAAENKDFDVSFKIVDAIVDEAALDKLFTAAADPVAERAEFKSRLEAAMQVWKGREKKNAHNPGTTGNPVRQMDVTFDNFPPLEFEWPVDPPLPEQFAVFLKFIAKVELGTNLIQLVPGQTGNAEDGWSTTNTVDIGVVLQPEQLKTMDSRDAYIGWAYAADPRFAYEWGSAIVWMTRDLAMSMEGEAPTEGTLAAWMRKMMLLDDIAHNHRDDHINPFMKFLLQDSSERTFTGGPTGATDGLYMPDWSDSLYSDTVATDSYSKMALTMVRNGHPESIGELGNLVVAPLRTIALFDGTHPVNRSRTIPRNTVLDLFTLHAPRTPTDQDGPHLTAELKNGRVNLNPPFTAYWTTNEETGVEAFVSDDASRFNREPLTAVFAGLPLNEYGETRDGMGNPINDREPLPWSVAAVLASNLIHNTVFQNHDLSILGSGPTPSDRLDRVLAAQLLLSPCEPELVGPSCDFEREALIRNSVELLTTRQQLFTIILRADAFTPKFGYQGALQGTTLSTAHAIVEVWRDPEPVRDYQGKVLWLDENGNKVWGGPRPDQGVSVHPWFIRYLHQF